MENENCKDMIIKLRMPSSTLQQLLEIAATSGLPLNELFQCFIDDLVDDSSPGSSLLEDWLYLRSDLLTHEAQEDPEEEVTFSKNQIEMMNLLDLIMDK